MYFYDFFLFELPSDGWYIITPLYYKQKQAKERLRSYFIVDLYYAFNFRREKSKL